MKSGMNTLEGTIKFHMLAAVRLQQRQQLKAFLKKAAAREGQTIHHLSYIFCSDQYLLTINRDFLQHDDYTDIITFDLSETGGELVGEIYISVPRVRENARLFNVSLDQELHRVMFHGLLHLCGFTDKTPKSKQVMTLQENRWLRDWDRFKLKASVPRGTSR